MVTGLESQFIQVESTPCVFDELPKSIGNKIKEPIDVESVRKDGVLLGPKEDEYYSIVGFHLVPQSRWEVAGSLYVSKERTHGGQICGNLTSRTAIATVVTSDDYGYLSINPETPVSITCQTDGTDLRVAKTMKDFENLSPKVLEKITNSIIMDLKDFGQYDISITGLGFPYKSIQCLLGISSTTHCWLYNSVDYFLKNLLEWVSHDDDRQAVFAMALRKHNSGNFDCTARTKTLKDLMLSSLNFASS
ncbi:hypothetical protein E3N88_11933 [Mikania micrantha]|uniref:Uncharacterized protein n=1 Tax=Mikania micrantha TaxID=192012 RepID=A0A5N6P429_9ASTR|nr:hypothetical protein E3N88_11933 [Mikania micrantha]